MDPLLRSYAAGYEDGGFDAGIKWALEALLRSRPSSCCASSATRSMLQAGAPYRISDIDLASRLSFFLWSSIPDDELLALAAAGRLREPAVLERQVLRMLDDPRSSALTANFGPGSGCISATCKPSAPNGRSSRRSTTTCARPSGAETELFFDSQVRADRSVLELLSPTTRS